MKSQKKKAIKKIVLATLVVCLIIGSYFTYDVFFRPHRDVKNTKADFAINAANLVDEYLANADKANLKYLSEDGDSKIFEVEGRVDQVFKNQKNQDVVLLKGEGKELGVQCTFILGESIIGIEVGSQIKVKGKIEQGASYDTDLEIGDDVIIGECSLVK